MIVTTNGCYDGLHPGHLFLFGYAKALAGDGRFIVGINSDEYIRRKKNRKPYYLLEQRRTILYNIGMFDEIYNFDDDTPNEFIRYIKPDIHCIGEEYAPNPAEKVVCDELGIKLVYVPRIKNLASSQLNNNFIRKFNRLFL